MRLQVGLAVRCQTNETRLHRSTFLGTNIAGHLPRPERNSITLTWGNNGSVLRVEVWSGGEAGLAEGTLTGPMQPPVLPDAAQAEAVATGDGDGAGEVVEADTAPDNL